MASIIIAFGRDKASSAINYTSDLVAGEKVSIPENPNWRNELSGVSQNTTFNTTPTQTSESALTESTLTDTVSTAFISNYLALKQNGNLNSTSAQDLIDKTISYIGQNSSQVTKISESQLNVVADNGNQSIMDYGENFGNIIKNNTHKEVENELEIIMDAMNSKDSLKINELNNIIAVYEKTFHELIKIPVPKTFVKVHLNLVNSINGIYLALTEIKNVFSDPIRGLTALKNYKENATIFIQAKKALIDFILKNNVVYKQGGGGYYLLNNI